MNKTFRLITFIVALSTLTSGCLATSATTASTSSSSGSSSGGSSGSTTKAFNDVSWSSDGSCTHSNQAVTNSPSSLTLTGNTLSTTVTGNGQSYSAVYTFSDSSTCTCTASFTVSGSAGSETAAGTVTISGCSSASSVDATTLCGELDGTGSFYYYEATPMLSISSDSSATTCVFQ